MQLDQGDWMHLRREELEKIIQRQDSEERMIEETASARARMEQEAGDRKPLAGLAAIQKAGKMLATVLKIKAFHADVGAAPGTHGAG